MSLRDIPEKLYRIRYKDPVGNYWVTRFYDREINATNLRLQLRRKHGITVDVDTLDIYKNIHYPVWVKVEDRLPENSRQVLIVSQGTINKGVYDNKELSWHLISSDGEQGSSVLGVTHWCELPKSPNFPSTESLYLDNTYGKGVTIELRPGMGFFLYTDGGPGGICGQSMDITCPHANLFTFDCEESLNKFVENFKGRNKKCRIWFGVVDKYTSGGQFSIGTVRNKNTGDDHCVIK